MENKNSFKLVLERLADAEQILRLGVERGKLSSIERDILLEKLRLSYDELFFGRHHELAENMVSNVTVESRENIPETNASPSISDAVASKESYVPLIKPPVEPEPKISQVDDEKEQEIVLSDSEMVIDFELEGIEESTLQNTTNELDEEVESLFNETPDRSSAPTLAEKYQGKQKFRNEVMGAGKKDMSSVIQNKPIADLTKAIGINDKFLFTKELFNGNAELYSKTIKQLNTFENINDAIIYIQENFSWDDRNEAANQLIELVRRKLMHD